MKKLFFLIVSGALVVGASAQTTKTIVQSMPVEMQPINVSENVVHKMETPSYFNHTMLTNAPAYSKKVHKSNYTPFEGPYDGFVRSTEFALPIAGANKCDWATGNPSLSTFALFPDSLGVVFWDYPADPSRNRNAAMMSAIGFTFDPYSKAFNSVRNKRLFTSTTTPYDSFCSYRIDDLVLFGDYRIADYDPNSPDTLRVFITHHHAYALPGIDAPDLRGLEYFQLQWTSSGVKFITPIIEYDDDNGSVPVKGSATRPVAESRMTLDYILSPQDSVDWDMRYIYRRAMHFEDVNYEVPVGSVVSIVMQFVPGYDYQDGDTIKKYEYNITQDRIDMLEVRKNIFAACVISDTAFDEFIDWGGGFNIRLAENMEVRYNTDSSKRYYNGSYNPLGLSAYLTNYYAFPYVWLGLSTDDDWVVIDYTHVQEPNAIISKVYPNPANNQVQIELINSGTAELTITNTVGQVVKIATLSEMTNTVDVSSLSPGMYVLKVSQGGSAYTTKITKR